MSPEADSKYYAVGNVPLPKPSRQFRNLNGEIIQ